jgi:hypothetical protein
MAETTMHCGNPRCGKAIRICPEGASCEFARPWVHLFTGKHPCGEDGQLCATPDSGEDSAPDGFIVLRADGGTELLSLKEAATRAAKGNSRAALGGREAPYVIAEVRIRKEARGQ